MEKYGDLTTQQIQRLAQEQGGPTEPPQELESPNPPGNEEGEVITPNSLSLEYVRREGGDMVFALIAYDKIGKEIPIQSESKMRAAILKLLGGASRAFVNIEPDGDLALTKTPVKAQE